MEREERICWIYDGPKLERNRRRMVLGLEREIGTICQPVNKRQSFSSILGTSNSNLSTFIFLHHLMLKDRKREKEKDRKKERKREIEGVNAYSSGVKLNLPTDE